MSAKNKRSYPYILYKDQIYQGNGKGCGTFHIDDFPIPRKGSLWDNFPTSFSLSPSSKELSSFVPFNYPKLISKSYSPTEDAYPNILHKIQASPADKVVLARATTLTFESNIDPVGLFHKLKGKSIGAVPFGIFLSPELAFVGATPELLYKRDGRKIETMALAGTRTHELEHELLSSEKDREEFMFVKDGLSRQLKELCEPFEVDDELEILRTTNLSHLYYSFHCTLKNDVSDEVLIKKLHPTPAICGFPKEGSLKAIKQHETIDRGWYCGTLRFTDGDKSEVYVPLRCAQITENKMHIFTGGGIVKKSVSKNEWTELENKMGLFEMEEQHVEFYV